MRDALQKKKVVSVFSFLFLATLSQRLEQSIKLMEIYMCYGPNIQRGHIGNVEHGQVVKYQTQVRS